MEEWIDYLEDVANRKITVDGLSEGMTLSPAEREALLAVFPTQHEILSFAQAGKNIHKSGKTITSQFGYIYTKFGVEPATPQELARRIRIG
jgi:hypothetical protein